MAHIFGIDLAQPLTEIIENFRVMSVSYYIIYKSRNSILKSKWAYCEMVTPSQVIFSNFLSNAFYQTYLVPQKKKNESKIRI